MSRLISAEIILLLMKFIVIYFLLYNDLKKVNKKIFFYTQRSVKKEKKIRLDLQFQ